MEIIINNENDTIKLGLIIAKITSNKNIFCFKGDLGAGKTTLIRNIIRNLTNVKEVPSPTFPMLLNYQYNNITIYHYDMYRLNKPEDVWNLNLEEALNNGIVFIEWPEIIEPFLPKSKITITISIINNNIRNIKILANKEFINKIENCYKSNDQKNKKQNKNKYF